jgi:hypothetical protein
VTIPAGTPAGTWYLIAKADADGAVPESFEINNTHYIDPGYYIRGVR